ncbi:TIGR03013 family XrtA/PEP-CTERM system glycosyltransferase [Undibacterium sp. SXout20W]|uniref:TIGR03013 family XrtA/PEP-CTERM system glycosyltransferase n=1 Tax=Undibacterium sp. SXout20W TaxID=3413051 RepID=UPI003BF226E3
MRIANHHVPQFTVFFLLFETLLAILAVYLAAYLRFPATFFHYIQTYNNFFLTAVIFAFILIFSMSALGMFHVNFHKDLRGTILRLMPALLLTVILLILGFYIFPDLYLGRGILFLVMINSAIFILIARIVVYKSSDSSLIKSRIAFLGCGELANECAKLALNNNSYNRYSIVGFIPVEGETCMVSGDKVLANEGGLAAFCQKNKVTEVIVAVNNRRGQQFPLKELLDCKLAGIKVIDASSFFERESCQIRVNTMQPGWLVFGDGFNQSFLRGLVKRSFDLIASIVILLMTVVIMLVTAILIYFEDRGSIFYKQERVGLNGKTYNVLKFRSMRADAEADGKPQWASSNDQRVTRVGKVIRLLRIDELPQIINVIKGDMSFVGPRPERPFFVDKLINEVPFYNMRHSIKPGITGIAQVRYGYTATKEDTIQKLQYDLYYVKNNSLFLDLLIMLETIQVVLFGKGAR